VVRRRWPCGVSPSVEYARLREVVSALPDLDVLAMRRDPRSGEVLGRFLPHDYVATGRRRIEISRRWCRTRGTVLAILVHEAAHALGDARRAPRRLRFRWWMGEDHGGRFRAALLLVARRGYGFVPPPGTGLEEVERLLKAHCQRWAEDRKRCAVS